MLPKRLTPFQRKLVKKEVDKELKSAEKKLEKDVEKKVEARLHKKFAKKLKESSSSVVFKFRDHATTAMIAALSFVIAIAWKDLIVKVIRENTRITAIESHPYLAEFYSAIIVTIIAVIGIMVISNWSTKKE